MATLRNVVVVVVAFLLPLLGVYSSGSALNDDVLALIVFKAGLTDPHSRLASWSEEDDSACSWVGVKCDQNSSRVSELILDGFSLSGHMGKNLGRLQNLTVLQLSRNNFSGNVNPILSQLRSLRVLDLSDNSFSGLIPEELFQQCGNLKAISLARNSFSGHIPDSLTSCSSLEILNFSSNTLAGQLPSELGSLTSLHSLDLSDNLLEGEVVFGIESLQRLKTLNLSRNKFVGRLPESIGRCLPLRSVDLSRNYFTGGLPKSMKNLGFCKYLDLRGNFLAGEFPDWIREMRSLEFLDLSSNRFSGKISTSMGDLQSLKEVNLSRNQFAESLPLALENLMNLKVLDVSHNLLVGSLPSSVFKLSLETLRLSANRFGGNITFPSTWLPSYESLHVLDLSSNALSGEIPSAIVNFSRLQELDASRNALSGSIPMAVGEFKSVSILDLSHNDLSWSIPVEIGQVITLQELRLEYNKLTGEIPVSIGNCSSMMSLLLSHNNLSGAVPVEISNLSNLKLLDVSFNNFSGNLPKELANLSQLSLFNFSFNRLEGELPVGGIFNTIPPSSVIGNPSLCGSIVKHSCPSVHPKPLVLNPNSSVSRHSPLSQNLNHRQLVLSISTLVAIGAAVFIALGVVIICVLNMHTRTSVLRSPALLTSFGGNEFSPTPDTEANYGKLVMFSGDADFDTGAQSLLNKNCELGHGGFGSVYKTELQVGRSVAIKKLNATSLVKSQQFFEQEVKQLGKIRHPNLVALEGYYWTPSLQLLINEYVSGGSLYLHLHDVDSSNSLSWQQRFRVLTGAAKALSHLHQINVIHFNIKSKNILIDSSGEPKVGDFGLARILPALDHYLLSSKIQSALGYMAPEFACQTVKITEKCDIYGFGILILEVVSGKKPVEYMEDDVIVLCDVVRQAIDEQRFDECIDSKLKGKYSLDEAVSTIKLGLACASQVPSNRPDMEEVTRILQIINSSHGNKAEAE